MSKHTPGPWEVHSEPQGTWIMPPDPSGEPIAKMTRWSAVEADARLIAAAPDLLEALRPFAAREECEIGVIPNEDDDLHNQACGECGTILIARRAIAKAEGRD